MSKVVLALDVGDARIGLARGETGSSFAFGRGFIVRRSLEEDVKAVEAQMLAEGAQKLVVGLPRRSDGGDSAQTQKVRAFAKVLQEHGLELVFEDERFTTKIATRNLLSSGLSKRKRQNKGSVDEASAVLILESYLAKVSQTEGRLGR